jgi:hypothetical protein
MADLVDLQEVAHWWGSDITATAIGDIAVVGVGQSGQLTKSRQRVIRRLMTNPGQYLIGAAFDQVGEQAQIAGQMQLEPSVAPQPAPQVSISQAGVGGITASISYVTAPEPVPAVLSFTVSAPEAS